MIVIGGLQARRAPGRRRRPSSAKNPSRPPYPTPSHRVLGCPQKVAAPRRHTAKHDALISQRPPVVRRHPPPGATAPGARKKVRGLPRSRSSGDRSRGHPWLLLRVDELLEQWRSDQTWLGDDEEVWPALWRLLLLDHLEHCRRRAGWRLPLSEAIGPSRRAG